MCTLDIRGEREDSANYESGGDGLVVSTGTAPQVLVSLLVQLKHPSGTSGLSHADLGHWMERGTINISIMEFGQVVQIGKS